MSFRIERIWAWVSTDNADGDEGIVGIRMGDQWLPLVAADETRLRQLRPHVEQIVATMHKTVRLVKFETRVDVDVLEPGRGN